MDMFKKRMAVRLDLTIDGYLHLEFCLDHVDRHERIEKHFRTLGVVGWRALALKDVMTFSDDYQLNFHGQNIKLFLLNDREAIDEHFDTEEDWDWVLIYVESSVQSVVSEFIEMMSAKFETVVLPDLPLIELEP